MVGRPCLLEKGCLIHVDAKANAIETVPSTHGRKPGNAPSAFIALDQGLGTGFRDRHEGRQVDPHALRSGHLERGGPERKRLHEGYPEHAHGHQHDHGFGHGDLAKPAGGQGDFGSLELRWAGLLPATHDQQYGGLRAPRSEPGVTPNHDSPEWHRGGGYAAILAGPHEHGHSNRRTSNFHSTPHASSWQAASTLRRESTPFASAESTRPSPPPAATPLNQTNQNNEFVINLGPPIQGGTSIIVNKVITDASSSTVGTTTTAIQQSVTFVVNGRINLFQANEIDGNTTTGLVPTQFVSPPHRRPACCRAVPTWSPTWEEASRPDRSAISGSAATPRTSRPSRWRRISSRSLRPTRRPALR